MSQRGARVLCVTLVGLAVGFGVAGGRIYAKAWLAQRLLHRAWAATQAGGGPVKPWPWADTWPVARLSIPDRRIDLIVLADASGRSMAFGPGVVAGSAPPGAAGTTVLSGHRDTQFRFLKDLVPGDRIHLETADGKRHDYAVTNTLVVDAQNVEILWDTVDSRLTLVTCFPFDAIMPGGPLRYVVQAERIPAEMGPQAARPADPGTNDFGAVRQTSGSSGPMEPGTARLRELHVAGVRQHLVAVTCDDIGRPDEDADTRAFVQETRGQHEGRPDVEDVGRRPRDLERLEPARRVADADTVAEAHLEHVARPRLADDLERRLLDLGDRHSGPQLPEPGAQAAHGDVIELARRPPRRGAGDHERLHGHAVVTLLHAPDLEVHQIARLEEPIGRRAVAVQ
jgi:sortase A